MKFVSPQDFGKRLVSGSAQLSREEIEEALCHVPFLLNDALHRYFAELLASLGADVVPLKATMQGNLDAVASLRATM
jgi:hypothetical protein